MEVVRHARVFHGSGRSHNAYASEALRPYTALVWIVEDRRYDLSVNAFLMPVDLADLDARSCFGMTDIDPAQCNVLAEYRRTHTAGDRADLRAPVVHAVAVMRRFVAGEFQPDQFVSALLNKLIFQPEGVQTGMIRGDFTCRRADAVQTQSESPSQD
jgi:hypothetical protein